MPFNNIRTLNFNPTYELHVLLLTTNSLTIKIQKPTKWIKLPITAHEHDLAPLNQMVLFSKRSAAVIDGSEKHNSWLNFELQSPHVIERCSK